MHRKKFAEEIRRRFDNINKLSKKAVASFEKDTLHEFRVEVKKLRSLLHLLVIEHDNGEDLRIKGKLKTFYGYAGIIQNIQWQQSFINGLLPESSTRAVSDYLQALQKEMDAWKKDARALIKENRNFDKEKQTILEALPEKLTKTAALRFVLEKATEAESLQILTPVTENNLHSLRKALKDLLYTWTYVKDEAAQLPQGLAVYENIHSLAELLGMYGEQCAGLDFLQPGYIDRVTNEAGREVLRFVREQLLMQREKFKMAFLRHLLHIRKGSGVFVAVPVPMSN